MEDETTEQLLLLQLLRNAQDSNRLNGALLQNVTGWDATMQRALLGLRACNAKPFP